MREKAFSPNQTKKQSIQALREALACFAPSVDLDRKGYTVSFHDNLLPAVRPEDFEADLRQGDGNELETKFRAAHSSSALGVNCFAPFHSCLADLTILGKQEFDSFQFEAKCPTGLRGRRAPNLDLLLQTNGEIIGIESKLTEYLTRHQAKFSPAYEDQIQDHRRDQGWFKEMLRLMDEPRAYDWLNAAQLIKHAFGLDHSFPGKPVTLLYLFWEPAETEGHPVFTEHRREIDDFSKRISGSGPQFRAMSYPELWNSWQETAPDWLTDHLRNLSARYGMCLLDNQT
jgi:Restriction Endonuclease associating with ARP